MNRDSLIIRQRIVLLLRFLFWIIVLTAIGLSVWYATIITKNQNTLTNTEKQFIKGWSIAQTFIACIALPLGLMKIYSIINMIQLNYYKRKRLTNKLVEDRRMKIKNVLTSKKTKIDTYIHKNKIKSMQEKLNLIIFACSITKKLEGTILVEITKLFNSSEKITKEFIEKLNALLFNYEPLIIDSTAYKKAIKEIW